MENIELFTFSKGLHPGREDHALDEGELATASAIEYNEAGRIDIRTPMETVNTSVLGTIHSIHRFNNFLLAGDAANVRFKWDLDGYCNLYTPANKNFTTVGTLVAGKWRTADYNDCIFITDGT